MTSWKLVDADREAALAKRKSRAMRENAERADERRSLWAIPICQNDDSEAAIETRMTSEPNEDRRGDKKLQERKSSRRASPASYW